MFTQTVFRTFLILVFCQITSGSVALAAPSPVIVENIRHSPHKTYTRVVLDLSGRVGIKETTSQRRVTISLSNVRLSQKAQRVLKRKPFPRAIAVSQGQSHTVVLTLKKEAIRTYKLTTFHKPDRVAVDLYYKKDSKKDSPATVTTPSPSPQKAVPQKALKPETHVTKPKPANRPGRKAVTVVIDPGHGGKDPGAIGRKGTREKTITLQIAKRLRDLLQQRLHAKVLLTRSKDVFRNLDDRVAFAKDKKADLFLSIHVNSHPKQSIRGIEIYHFGKESDPRALAVAARENGMKLGDDAPPWHYILAEKRLDHEIEESRNFAETARSKLILTLQKHYTVKDHGVKKAPFYVLRFTSTSMPSILAEVGFLSNPSEETRLRNEQFQKTLAEGMYQGIQAYVIKSRARQEQAPPP